MPAGGIVPNNLHNKFKQSGGSSSLSNAKVAPKVTNSPGASCSTSNASSATATATPSSVQQSSPTSRRRVLITAPLSPPTTRASRSKETDSNKIQLRNSSIAVPPSSKKGKSANKQTDVKGKGASTQSPSPVHPKKEKVSAPLPVLKEEGSVPKVETKGKKRKSKKKKAKRSKSKRQERVATPPTPPIIVEFVPTKKGGRRRKNDDGNSKKEDVEKIENVVEVERDQRLLAVNFCDDLDLRRPTLTLVTPQSPKKEEEEDEVNTSAMHCLSTPAPPPPPPIVIENTEPEHSIFLQRAEIDDEQAECILPHDINEIDEAELMDTLATAASASNSPREKESDELLDMDETRKTHTAQNSEDLSPIQSQPPAQLLDQVDDDDIPDEQAEDNSTIVVTCVSSIQSSSELDDVKIHNKEKEALQNSTITEDCDKIQNSSSIVSGVMDGKAEEYEEGELVDVSEDEGNLGKDDEEMEEKADCQEAEERDSFLDIEENSNEGQVDHHENIPVVFTPEKDEDDECILPHDDNEIDEAELMDTMATAASASNSPRQKESDELLDMFSDETRKTHTAQNSEDLSPIPSQPPAQLLDQVDDDDIPDEQAEDNSTIVVTSVQSKENKALQNSITEDCDKIQNSSSIVSGVMDGKVDEYEEGELVDVSEDEGNLGKDDEEMEEKADGQEAEETDSFIDIEENSNEGQVGSKAVDHQESLPAPVTPEKDEDYNMEGGFSAKGSTPTSPVCDSATITNEDTFVNSNEPPEMQGTTTAVCDDEKSEPLEDQHEEGELVGVSEDEGILGKDDEEMEKREDCQVSEEKAPSHDIVENTNEVSSKTIEYQNILPVSNALEKDEHDKLEEGVSPERSPPAKDSSPGCDSAKITNEDTFVNSNEPPEMQDMTTAVCDDEKSEPVEDHNEEGELVDVSEDEGILGKDDEEMERMEVCQEAEEKACSLDVEENVNAGQVNSKANDLQEATPLLDVSEKDEDDNMKEGVTPKESPPTSHVCDSAKITNEDEFENSNEPPEILDTSTAVEVCDDEKSELVDEEEDEVEETFENQLKTQEQDPLEEEEDDDDYRLYVDESNAVPAASCESDAPSETQNDDNVPKVDAIVESMDKMSPEPELSASRPSTPTQSQTKVVEEEPEATSMDSAAEPQHKSSASPRAHSPVVPTEAPSSDSESMHVSPSVSDGNEKPNATLTPEISNSTLFLLDNKSVCQKESAPLLVLREEKDGPIVESERKKRKSKKKKAKRSKSKRQERVAITPTPPIIVEFVPAEKGEMRTINEDESSKMEDVEKIENVLEVDRGQRLLSVNFCNDLHLRRPTLMLVTPQSPKKEEEEEVNTSVTHCKSTPAPPPPPPIVIENTEPEQSSFLQRAEIDDEQAECILPHDDNEIDETELMDTTATAASASNSPREKESDELLDMFSDKTRKTHTAQNSEDLSPIQSQPPAQLLDQVDDDDIPDEQAEDNSTIVVTSVRSKEKEALQNSTITEDCDKIQNTSSIVSGVMDGKVGEYEEGELVDVSEDEGTLGKDDEEMEEKADGQEAEETDSFIDIEENSNEGQVGSKAVDHQESLPAVVTTEKDADDNMIGRVSAEGSTPSSPVCDSATITNEDTFVNSNEPPEMQDTTTAVCNDEKSEPFEDQHEEGELVGVSEDEGILGKDDEEMDKREDCQVSEEKEEEDDVEETCESQLKIHEETPIEEEEDDDDYRLYVDESNAAPTACESDAPSETNDDDNVPFVESMDKLSPEPELSASGPSTPTQSQTKLVEEEPEAPSMDSAAEPQPSASPRADSPVPREAPSSDPESMPASPSESDGNDKPEATLPPEISDFILSVLDNKSNESLGKMEDLESISSESLASPQSDVENSIKMCIQTLESDSEDDSSAQISKETSCREKVELSSVSSPLQVHASSTQSSSSSSSTSLANGKTITTSSSSSSSSLTPVISHQQKLEPVHHQLTFPSLSSQLIKLPAVVPPAVSSVSKISTATGVTKISEIPNPLIRQPPKPQYTPVSVQPRFETPMKTVVLVPEQRSSPPMVQKEQISPATPPPPTGNKRPREEYSQVVGTPVKFLLPKSVPPVSTVAVASTSSSSVTTTGEKVELSSISSSLQVPVSSTPSALSTSSISTSASLLTTSLANGKIITTSSASSSSSLAPVVSHQQKLEPVHLLTFPSLSSQLIKLPAVVPPAVSSVSKVSAVADVTKLREIPNPLIRHPPKPQYTPAPVQPRYETPLKTVVLVPEQRSSPPMVRKEQISPAIPAPPPPPPTGNKRPREEYYQAVPTRVQFLLPQSAPPVSTVADAPTSSLSVSTTTHPTTTPVAYDPSLLYFVQPDGQQAFEGNYQLVYAAAAATTERDEGVLDGPPNKVRLLYAEALGVGSDSQNGNELQFYYAATAPDQHVQHTSSPYNVQLMEPCRVTYSQTSNDARSEMLQYHVQHNQEQQHQQNSHNLSQQQQVLNLSANSNPVYYYNYSNTATISHPAPIPPPPSSQPGQQQSYNDHGQYCSTSTAKLVVANQNAYPGLEPSHLHQHHNYRQYNQGNTEAQDLSSRRLDLPVHTARSNEIAYAHVRSNDPVQYNFLEKAREVQHVFPQGAFRHCDSNMSGYGNQLSSMPNQNMPNGGLSDYAKNGTVTMSNMGSSGSSAAGSSSVALPDSNISTGVTEMSGLDLLTAATERIKVMQYEALCTERAAAAIAAVGELARLKRMENIQQQGPQQQPSDRMQQHSSLQERSSSYMFPPKPPGDGIVTTTPPGEHQVRMQNAGPNRRNNHQYHHHQGPIYQGHSQQTAHEMPMGANPEDQQAGIRRGPRKYYLSRSAQYQD